VKNFEKPSKTHFAERVDLAYSQADSRNGERFRRYRLFFEVQFSRFRLNSSKKFPVHKSRINMEKEDPDLLQLCGMEPVLNRICCVSVK
jgi:hypothetical protein